MDSPNRGDPLSSALTPDGEWRCVGRRTLCPLLAKAGKFGDTCKKKCQRQVAKCEDVIRAFCVEQSGGMGCLQTLLPCCDHLGRCNSAASTQCFIDELFDPT